MKINLQSIRTESKADLARALDVHPNTIGNIERNGICTLDLLHRLCQHYHVYAVISEQGEVTFHKSESQEVIKL